LSPSPTTRTSKRCAGAIRLRGLTQKIAQHDLQLVRAAAGRKDRPGKHGCGAARGRSDRQLTLHGTRVAERVCSEELLTTLIPKEYRTINVASQNTTRVVPRWRPFPWFFKVQSVACVPLSELLSRARLLQADPVQYLQQEVFQQLYSNDVFLTVQHNPQSSQFVVFNEVLARSLARA
jgi:hypothetical protein